MKYAIIHALHNTWEYDSDDLEEIMRIFKSLDHKYESYIVVEVLTSTDSI